MPEFEDNSILGEDIYHAVQFEGRQNTSGMYTKMYALYRIKRIHSWINKYIYGAENIRMMDIEINA